jgi:hypothetical protein
MGTNLPGQSSPSQSILQVASIKYELSFPSPKAVNISGLISISGTIL